MTVIAPESPAREIRERPESSPIDAFVCAALAARFADLADNDDGTPQRLDLSGVAVFVDGCGYSKLANELTDKFGRQGPEEITKVVNGAFRGIIDTVYEAGGHVAAFYGDAVLLLWIGEGADVAALTEHALAACAGFTAGGGSMPLKLGVGSGGLTIVRVGGHAGRWELLVAGVAVERAHTAIKEAAEGETILHADSAPTHWPRTAAGHAKVSGFTAANIARAQPAPVRGNLRGFVPEFIEHITRQLGDSWLFEARPISAVFFHLAQADGSNDPAARNLNRIIRRIQAAVRQAGGSLWSVAYDDKGVYATAAFGLPYGESEHRPRDILAAALEICERAGRYTMVCSAGVAHGRALCGPVGTPRRRHYTVVGSSINLAARLMQAAAGKVSCDRQFQDWGAGGFDFRRLVGVTLKSFAADTEAYEVAARTVPAAEDATERMFGRRSEMGQIVAALGRGESVHVVGEPGIGKSTLIATVARRCDAARLKAVLCGGDRMFRRTPYHAWKNIFHGLLAFDESMDPAARTARVAQTLSGSALGIPDIALLNSLLGTAFASPPHLRELRGAARALRMQAAARALFHLTAQPGDTVLVIDDVQWLDAASLVLLRQIAESPDCPALLLGERKARKLLGTEVLEAARRALVVELAPLNAADTGDIAAAQLGVDAVPAEVAAWIHDVCAGNPYFCRQLTLDLLESGALKIVGRDVSVTKESLDSIKAAGSRLESIIMRRIDRLDLSSQVILKAASILGRRFAAETLFDILQRQAFRVDPVAAMTTLAASAILRSDDGEVYAFDHQLTLEAIYDIIPGEHRRALHADAARAITSFAPDDTMLAHHWRSAGRAGRAMVYLERAGERATSQGAYGDARTLLSDLIQLDEDPGRGLRRTRANRQAGWRGALAQSCWSTGALDAATVQAKLSLKQFGLGVPRSGAGWFLALPQALFVSLAKPPAPAAGRLEHVGAATSAIVIAQVEYFRGDPVRILGTSLLSLITAWTCRHSMSIARPAGYLGFIAGLMRMQGVANALFRRGEISGERTGDVAGITYCLGGRALRDLAFGSWETAEADIDAVLTSAQEMREYDVLELATSVKGLIAYYTGRFADSRRWFNTLAERAGKRGSNQHLAWGLYAAAQAAIVMGEIEQAPAQIDRALEIIGADSDLHSAIICHGLKAACALRQGRMDDACTAAGLAAAAVRKCQPNNFSTLEGYASAAEALLIARGNAGDLKTLLRVLAVYAMAFPIGRPRLAYLRGLQAALAGDRTAAATQWRKSIRQANALGMPPEAERATAALAGIGEATAAVAGLIDPAYLRPVLAHISPRPQAA